MSKIDRMLTLAQCYDRSERFALVEQGSIGKLALAGARNQLLQHDLACLDHCAGLIVARNQFRSICHQPGFLASKAARLVLGRRLQNHWKDRVAQHGILSAPRVKRSWIWNAQVFRQLIGETFVVSPTKPFPWRRSQ